MSGKNFLFESLVLRPGAEPAHAEDCDGDRNNYHHRPFIRGHAFDVTPQLSPEMVHLQAGLEKDASSLSISILGRRIQYFYHKNIHPKEGASGSVACEDARDWPFFSACQN
jgi:hypothetical protein